VIGDGEGDGGCEGKKRRGGGGNREHAVKTSVYRLMNFRKMIRMLYIDTYDMYQ
jgi:hypothetical protein